jgi:DNA-binding protein H-NS
MSLRELKDLKQRVDRAIDTFEDRKKKEALAHLEERARELGYTLPELTASMSMRGRKKSAPKYANPDKPSETWTGKGRPPKWYTAALASGKADTDMLI